MGFLTLTDMKRIFRTFLLIFILTHGAIGQTQSFCKNLVGNLRQDARLTGNLLIKPPVQGYRTIKSHPAKSGLIFTGLVLGFQMDKPVRNLAIHNDDNQTVSDFFQYVNYLGDSKYILMGIASSYGLGLTFNHQELRTTSIEMFASLTIAGTASSLLKKMTGRYRPLLNKGPYQFISYHSNEFSEYSFPSGHSTVIWSVTTILAGHSRHKWQKHLLYALATSTSMARVYKDKHWFTDITAGALLGYFTGRMVLKISRSLSRQL